jgi:hypothetical protein
MKPSPTGSRFYSCVLPSNPGLRRCKSILTLGGPSAFYAAVLQDLRKQMPPNLPLSITALASWCSNDDWISGLPIDEAVPMLFRMEPDRRHAPEDLPQFQIREPKCMGSAGISTREQWPDQLAGKRIYVFADRGWHDDLDVLARRELP